MSFQAKSNAAMFGVIALVYGAYFAIVLSWAAESPAEDIVYQPLMLLTVVPVVVLAVLAHLVIALTKPSEAGVTDERDRAVEMRGEVFGGIVLAAGAFVALALAMVEAHQFWLAQTILAAIVLAQLTKEAVTIVAFWRGG